MNGHRLVEAQPYALTLAPGKHTLIVADGMGGHVRGDLARNLVLQVLEERANDLHNTVSCVEALRAANLAVYDRAREEPAFNAMGCTVVGAAIEGSACRWFNVGDSRAYHFDGALRQVSRDHVPPTPDGRRTHSVTQSLGGKPVFQEIWPASGHFNLRRGDSVLLCSDGLTDVLADSEIAAVFAEGFAGTEIVARLLSSCLSKGAPDNVTMVIATLGRQPGA